MVRKVPARAVRKIKEESKELQREVRKRTTVYITAALGLVVGLAWNEAIKAVIEYFFPLGENSVAAKLVYAAILTTVLVIVTTYLIKEESKASPGAGRSREEKK